MSQVTMRLLGLAKAHVESTGGTVDRMTCKFDEKRGGRVVNLVVFWPGDLGYSDARVTASDSLRAAADERGVSVNFLIERACEDFLARLIPVDEMVWTRDAAVSLPVEEQQ